MVQWIGIDDEADIVPVLHSHQLQELLTSESTERTIFDTGPAGDVRLIDSADIGTDLKLANRKIRLAPGRYEIRSNYYESENLMAVFRKFELH